MGMQLRSIFLIVSSVIVIPQGFLWADWRIFASTRKRALLLNSNLLNMLRQDIRRFGRKSRSRGLLSNFFFLQVLSNSLRSLWIINTIHNFWINNLFNLHSNINRLFNLNSLLHTTINNLRSL
ncbi:hypothetical protein HanRHA438_Chr16g0751781 [Helianthus annuus]|nr:hypothetical protein HanRHA438_Chr16g0751781 [Helianthus annuus]